MSVAGRWDTKTVKAVGFAPDWLMCQPQFQHPGCLVIFSGIDFGL